MIVVVMYAVNRVFKIELFQSDYKSISTTKIKILTTQNQNKRLKAISAFIVNHEAEELEWKMLLR